METEKYQCYEAYIRAYVSGEVGIEVAQSKVTSELGDLNLKRLSKYDLKLGMRVIRIDETDFYEDNDRGLKMETGEITYLFVQEGDLPSKVRLGDGRKYYVYGALFLEDTEENRKSLRRYADWKRIFDIAKYIKVRDGYFFDEDRRIS